MWTVSLSLAALTFFPSLPALTLSRECQRKPSAVVKATSSEAALLSTLGLLPQSERRDWAEEDVLRAGASGLLNIALEAQRSKTAILVLSGIKVPQSTELNVSQIVVGGSASTDDGVSCLGENAVSDGAASAASWSGNSSVLPASLVCESTKTALSLRLKASEDGKCVEFDLNDECLKQWLGSLESIQDFTSQVMSPLTKGTVRESVAADIKCFSSVEQQQVASEILSGVVSEVLTSASEAVDGNLLVIELPSPCGGYREVESIAEPLSFFEEAADAPAQQKRSLAAVVGPNAVPRTMVIWLSIMMAVAVVFAVIPLLQLSSVSDPIICTRLFSVQH